jgi:PEGA domain
VQIALVQKRTVTQALPVVRPLLASEPTDEEETRKRGHAGAAPTGATPAGVETPSRMSEVALAPQPSLAPSLAVSFPPMEVEPVGAPVLPLADFFSGEVGVVDLPPTAPALTSSQWTPAGPPFAQEGAPERGAIASSVEESASPFEASVDPALFLGAAVPPSRPRIEPAANAQVAIRAPLPIGAQPEIVSIGLLQTAVGTPAFPVSPNALPKAPRKRGWLLPLLFAGGSCFVLVSGLVVWLARVPDAPRVPSEAATQTSGVHGASSTSGSADPNLAVTGQPAPSVTVTASAAFAQVAVTPSKAAALTATSTPTTPVAAASHDSSSVPQGSTRLVTEGAAPGRRIFVDGRVVGQTPASVLVACGSHRVKVGSSGTERRVDLPCGQSFFAK